MSERQLYLLSPYRLPTHHQVLLNEDEMAAWLNGFVSLWHPALIHGAKEPPKVDSPYDHEMPSAGHVFAIPAAPPLFQPDDWPFRLLSAGAIRYEATADRTSTIANLLKAVREVIAGDAEEGKQAFGSEEVKALLELPPDKVQPFLGLGFGYMMIESLFDAMEHEHLLSVGEFWSDIQSAIAAVLRPDGEVEYAQHLQQAAGRLLSAREVLYPIAVHVLDIVIFDEKKPDAALPGAFERGFPLNVITTGQALEKLAAERPERLRALKDKLQVDIQPPILEICGGHYREREDALMPIESQLWNFTRGKASIKRLLGVDVEVFGRRRTALHPQTPQFLHVTGFRHALLLNLDNAVVPSHRATVVNWSAPDGKSIDAFTRTPLNTHLAQTFFNLVYNLHQSITQDTAPTLALLHQAELDSPSYGDWLALSKLAPVLGQWTTFSRYFSDALAGEYAGAANPDDFFSDYLDERINNHRSDPLSAFGRQVRVRRRIESAWALAAIHRALCEPTDEERQTLGKLQAAEDALETEGLDGIAGAPTPALDIVIECDRAWAEKITARLQARAEENQPGYMLLNPCAFPRRIALELDPVDAPFALQNPVKAVQFDSDKLRLVVEVPPLGFAWIPSRGTPGTTAAKARLRLADQYIVRNEFFEAEIDPATGGLRSFRDLRMRVNRVAQQLIYNPGSKMEARDIKVTSNGAALGEIVSEGVILNEQNETLATFRQRFRAWMSRPMLDVRIEIEPVQSPTGYPWHAYFGSRFAWREEQATLQRGVNGTANTTNHTRPLSPDFLEIRHGRSNTLIFPGGLPFHQRHGSRMVDVILIPEGESARSFDLGLSLDRENPMQTALGFVSPIAVVPTTKGPPHVGPSGWLFHVDAPNLLMTSMKPLEVAGSFARAVRAHFLETTGFGGTAEWRCVRDPLTASVLDGEGTSSISLPISGDAVRIDFSANDLLHVQVDFS